MLCVIQNCANFETISLELPESVFLGAEHWGGFCLMSRSSRSLDYYARGMLRFPLTPFDQGESFSLSPLDPSLRHSLPAWGGLRSLPTPHCGNVTLHLLSDSPCYGVDMYEQFPHGGCQGNRLGSFSAISAFALFYSLVIRA